VVAGSCRQPQTYVKPEDANAVFELLMMSGVSLETCSAIKKHWNNKFYYTVASCWFFLYDLNRIALYKLLFTLFIQMDIFIIIIIIIIIMFRKD
jgi:hypothetical protein